MLILWWIISYYCICLCNVSGFCRFIVQIAERIESSVCLLGLHDDETFLIFLITHYWRIKSNYVYIGRCLLLMINGARALLCSPTRDVACCQQMVFSVNLSLH